MLDNEYFLANARFFSLPELNQTIEPSINQAKPNEVCSYDRLYVDPEININKKLIKSVSYKLNNRAQRSENFEQLTEDKTNILFAGCSTTFGQYLPEGYSWPYHLHKELSKTMDTNNINIIAYPGGSISKIINNIVKYIDEFGSPDYIFFLLPDPFRYVLPTEIGDSFSPVITYASHSGITEECKPYRGVFEAQQHYRMLKTICKLQGIKLYSYSWDEITNKIFTKLKLNNSDTIKVSGPSDLLKELDLKMLEQFDSGFFISAADDLHPGLLENIGIARGFQEMFENDK